MMTAIECPTHDQLKALTLGQLSDENSSALFSHIAECEACRSELETVEDLGDSLIVSLRDPSSSQEYFVEPDCRVAVVKALGALALSESDTESRSAVGAIPKSIGEYELIRPIGSGGMGNVFLAQHTKLGRQVALKVLASHRLADKRMLERFEAEMRAVGRLSHPNIVTAHDAREVDGTAILVTEFVSGLDLGQLLQRTGTLNISDACEIARQVAVALAYTNSQGFVHRDVKPSNVMLSEEGSIKLLDLGLARLQYGENGCTEITGTGQAMGTADYVAPEQVTDSKTVDIRADIYALGCTLFKLLTGRAPFADDLHMTTFAKMTAHVSKKAPSLGAFLPTAPRSLVQLVDGMLAKNPEDRPQLPQEIATALSPHANGHDLRKLISDALISEPRNSLASTSSTSSEVAKPKTQSWMKRNVPFSAAIAAGFLGVLFGVFLSIIVVITNPDGTKTLLRLAEGSSVEVKEEHSPASNPKGTKAILSEPLSSQNPNENVANIVIMPLSFGILVNRDSTGHSPSASESQIVEATRLLRASDGSKPVLTEVGIWYPVNDPDLGAPIKELNAGKQFVLVSDQSMIRWQNIQGHVLDIVSRPEKRQPDVELTFDKELGRQMNKFTKENLRRQLAIIVNGKVRSAPIILSEIGERVSITGIWEAGEAEQQLGESLRRALQLPTPKNMSSTQSSDSRTLDVLARDKTSERNAADLRGQLRDLEQMYKEGEKSFGSNHPSVGRIQDKIDSVEAQLSELKSAPSTSDSGSLRRTNQDDPLHHNLTQIGLSFHNFHAAYGKFPGTSNTHEGSGSTSGEKKIYPFSWRVAILPFIERLDLFQQYHFEEPWDSEHNLTLLDKMPTIYRSPFSPADQEAGETNMLGFATEDSALGLAGGEKISSFTDGISNTLLLVETECTVPWTKPQDIPGDAGQARFFEDHPFTCLMADGKVFKSEKRLSDDVLNGMISRNGGRAAK